MTKRICIDKCCWYILTLSPLSSVATLVCVCVCVCERWYMYTAVYTDDGKQSDSTADVEQHWYNSELSGVAGDFYDEANSKRFHQITMHASISFVRRRISIDTAAAS